MAMIVSNKIQAFFSCARFSHTERIYYNITNRILSVFSNYMMNAFLIELSFYTFFSYDGNNHVHHVLHKTFLYLAVLLKLALLTYLLLNYKLKIKKNFSFQAGRLFSSFMSFPHSNKSLWWCASPWELRFENIFLKVFCTAISPHYSDPLKTKPTLMNQWPFNHTKKTKQKRKILGVNENGQ